MKQLANTPICILLLAATSALALPKDFDPELVGTHSGGFGQLGIPATDGTLMFGEHQFTLGGVEFRDGGTLVVWFVPKGGGVGTTLEFPFVKEHIHGALAVWKPLIIGEKKYTAELFRYGGIFRVLVKLYKGDRVVSGIQWVCAEPTKAEQVQGVSKDVIEKLEKKHKIGLSKLGIEKYKKTEPFIAVLRHLNKNKIELIKYDFIDTFVGRSHSDQEISLKSAGWNVRLTLKNKKGSETYYVTDTGEVKKLVAGNPLKEEKQ